MSDPISQWGSLELPYSQEAEEAVLGAIITDGSRFEQCARILKGESFFILRHRYIWEALAKLVAAEKPIDYLTVCDQLKADKRLAEIGGGVYISQILITTPTSAHAVIYAGLVASFYTRRQMMAAADDYKALALDSKIDVDQAVTKGQEVISAIQPVVTRKRAKSMHDIMSSMYDEFEERIASGISTMGINTGYIRLNEILGGWRGGRVHVVGGRPGMGKTALMLDCAVRVARQAKPKTAKPYNVLFVSMEMKAAELGERLLSNQAALTSHQVLSAKLTAEQQTKMTAAFGTLHTLSIFIEDEADVTPARLKEMCAECVVDNGSLDLLVVDYLGLMKPDFSINARNRNRENEVASISREMKVIAGNFNVPILLGCQLNRGVEERSIHKRRPLMSDLRDSGATEQDADVVLFPYFHNYYINPDMKIGEWEVRIAKQRNGGLGTMFAHADFSHMNFTERPLHANV